ncbi:MAG: hypothetical protein V3V67_18710, partial [Myxococcota bacterium]
GMLYGATGQDAGSLLRSLVSDQAAVALYPGSRPGTPRWLAAVRARGDTIERLLLIGAIVFQWQRVDLVPASEGRAAVFGYGDKVFGFRDGDVWVLGSDRELVEQALRGPRRPLSRDPRIRAARARLPSAHTGFAFLDLEPFAARLAQVGKPPNIGAALLLGALAEQAPRAPWLALGAALEPADADLRLALSALIPTSRASRTAREAFAGTLEPLPFDLGDRALGQLRLHRDVGALWSHRDDLIAEAGIPGLVTFETNFGVITGGMNLVEEFLPSLVGDVSIVATRASWGQGPAPLPRYPQAALLLRIREPAELAPRLAVGFQTLIGLVNANRSQNGQKPLLLGSETHDGVVVHSARFLAPTPAEMEGLRALPVRFNFSPAHAVVGEHLVLATAPDIVRELIDAHGTPPPETDAVNARLALRGSEVARTLEENREPLIAQNMLNEGNSREEAERAIGFVLDVARYIRGATLSHESLDGMARIDLQIGLGAPEP